MVRGSYKRDKTNLFVSSVARNVISLSEGSARALVYLPPKLCGTPYPQGVK